MEKSIPEIMTAIKSALRGDLYVVLVIILVGGASFGLGRLSSTLDDREPVLIENAPQIGTAAVQSAVTAPVNSPQPTSAEGQFVASKNSDKYHFPWCSGAARIKEENKIWFSSKAAAAAAGYIPAANCAGLE